MSMKTEGKLKIGNEELAYTEYPGEGTPIVFIHGFPLDQRMWDKQVDELTKAGRHVITYDMRGFGKSSDPKESYSHEEDLKALLDELKIKECNLVGMSFGGEIATSFTLTHPEYVQELTLVASGIGGYIPKENSPFGKWIELARKDGEGLKTVKAEICSYGELGEMAESNPTLHSEISQIVNDWRGYGLLDDKRIYPSVKPIERLAEIKCKTRVVIGLDDSLDSLEQAKELATKIPNCEYKEIADTGHFMNMEKPNVVNDVVLQMENRKEKNSMRDLNATISEMSMK